VENKKPPTQNERFDRLVRDVGEHFGDYAILVRLSGGGWAYRGSNENWTLGTMEKLKTTIRAKDTAAFMAGEEDECD